MHSSLNTEMVGGINVEQLVLMPTRPNIPLGSSRGRLVRSARAA
jgi:hypothetical protein